MKTTKRIFALFISVILLVSALPICASAASYENPVFKLSVVSESNTNVVVSLDLVSGKFNNIDFAFKVKSGYTCENIRKSDALLGSDDAMVVSNKDSLCVAFISTVTYGTKGSFVTATFKKATSGKKYANGDITVVFDNCGLSVSGSGNVSLNPTLGAELKFEDVTVNYGQTFSLEAPGEKCTWSSSNPKVATVDDAGNVRAAGKGVAVISATCNGKVTECTVTVNFTFIQAILYYICFGWIWMK